MAVLRKIKKAKPTKRYLITKQRTLKKHWRALPKEEKTELKRLVKTLAVTLLTIILLYYGGINLLTKVGGFWATLRGRSGEFFQKDTTAPPPPFLSPLPLYTKEAVIKIEGYAEPGAKVTLFVNESEVEATVAEKTHHFSFAAVTLKEGENKITAIAKDGAGNESLESSALKIILDKKPPELSVNQPKEEQVFTGENNKIDVAGKTEPGATVKINDHQAAVLADGSFSFAFIANNEGEIKITVVATDRAGNESKTQLTVTYSSTQ